MITQTGKTGLWGEIYAARYLRQKGYRIIASNYRLTGGEIDIIAEKGDVICFTEVKTRSENSFFSPAEAVDSKKEDNIKNVASAYNTHNNINKTSRFDIIEIIFSEENYKLRHIENAF